LKDSNLNCLGVSFQIFAPRYLKDFCDRDVENLGTVSEFDG